jgi:HPt (histidine-containing phosphotransfer) domain-containing protein
MTAEHTDPSVTAVLDTATGLSRVLGDRDLYGRMLRRFQKDYGSCLTHFDDAAAADLPAVRHHAHTLKGAAGMIGASAVQRCADVVELGSPEAALAALGPLRAALGELFALLEQTQHAQFPPAAPKSAHATLSELEHLLESGDGAAVDVLEDAGPALRELLGAERFARVQAEANDFEFERALLALRGTAP